MKRCMRILFLMVASLLYPVFLVLDLTRAADSAPVKFAAILLCAAAALCAADTPDGRLTALALLCAAGADFFLLSPAEHYAAGVLLFCLVQVLYRARLIRRLGPEPRALPILRLLPLISFFLLPSLLIALALLYFVNLICNTARAASLRPTDRRDRRFAAGLALLLCCDLCIGAFHLGLFSGFTRIGMWLFYLPSQVLVVLSAEPKGDHS